MSTTAALRHRFAGGFSLDAAFSAGAGVTALFGPSGYGKSTIIAAMAGLLRPDAGRIVVAGQTVFDSAAGVFLPPERRRCGVVFQDARLFPHLDVTSNLLYGARRAPRQAAGPGFEEVVALLGLEDLLQRRPRTLSGGERQRVALGRALLARPSVLLMDEPLSALDAERRTEVLPFLARLRARAGVPIVYVTHALEEVDAIADTLVLLREGRVLAQGPLLEIAARTDLPLAARSDAGVVVTARIAGHDRANGLTQVAMGEARLVLPLRPEPPGAAIRLRIHARDVALATERPRNISVQNVLPCRVVAVEAAPTPGEVFVRLDLAGTPLLSRVLRTAATALALAPGTPVFALVKGVAVKQAAPEDG